jgi:predicted transposase YbfD/YdcC
MILATLMVTQRQVAADAILNLYYTTRHLFGYNALNFAVRTKFTAENLNHTK